jgi:hypothetical protein
MGTDEPTTESDDVEAHQRPRMATDEPTADDESDDVEAHARRAQHRSA